MKQIPYQETNEHIPFCYANEIIPESFLEDFHTWMHENHYPRTEVVGSEELRCSPCYVQDYLMLIRGMLSEIVREDQDHTLRSLVRGTVKMEIVD